MLSYVSKSDLFAPCLLHAHTTQQSGTHTGTERPYLKTFFKAKLEETLNQVRLEEKLDDQPYEVIMSEHEEEVIQYV
jgi:hypothetical protein